MSSTDQAIAAADDVNDAIRECRPLRGERYHVLFALDGVAFSKIVLDDPVPTGRQILRAAGDRSVDDYALFVITEAGDFENVRPDEEVDLLDRRVHRFIAFSGDPLYRFLLDDMRLVWGTSDVPEEALRFLAGISDDEGVFLEIKGGTDRLVAPGTTADLSGRGVERFVTAPARASYRFFVNGRPYETGLRTPTGGQIKAMVPGWDPSSDLALEGEGDDPDRILGDGDVVDLDPAFGTRRFSSVPKATFG